MWGCTAFGEGNDDKVLFIECHMDEECTNPISASFNQDQAFIMSADILPPLVHFPKSPDKVTVHEMTTKQLPKAA